MFSQAKPNEANAAFCAERETSGKRRMCKVSQTEWCYANYLNIESEFQVFLRSRTGKLFDKKRECSYWSYQIRSEDQLFRYRRRTAEKCKKIFVFICEVGAQVLSLAKLKSKVPNWRRLNIILANITRTYHLFFENNFTCSLKVVTNVYLIA